MHQMVNTVSRSKNRERLVGGTEAGRNCDFEAVANQRPTAGAPVDTFYRSSKQEWLEVRSRAQVSIHVARLNTHTQFSCCNTNRSCKPTFTLAHNCRSCAGLNN